MVFLPSPVANHFEPPYHFADSEETKDLSEHYTCGR